MFAFLYHKFTEDDMYQTLSQSVRSCRLYIEKHFGVFTVYQNTWHTHTDRNTDCYLLKKFNFGELFFPNWKLSMTSPYST